MVPSLSRLHLSSIGHTEVGELLSAWGAITTTEDGEEYVCAENDSFHVEKRESRWNGPTLAKSAGGDGQNPEKTIDYGSIVKTIVPHDEAWPANKATPSFHHNVFYSSLKEYRQAEEDAEEWGSVLLYGEVVTSTNTLLDK